MALNRKFGVGVGLTLLVVGAVSWFASDDLRGWAYLAYRGAYLAMHPSPARCKKRSTEFQARVDRIRQAAETFLKVGTKKDDLVRFFASEKIPLSFEHLAGYEEARGSIYVEGLVECQNIACGDDSALIGVRVKIDADGAVLSDPEVIGMYTNCL